VILAVECGGHAAAVHFHVLRRQRLLTAQKGYRAPVRFECASAFREHAAELGFDPASQLR
jgi:hypothetical protein